MPNFTDGIQYINSSGIGSYVDTGVLISSGDLNTFYGTDYWGRQFYAVGGNTLSNTPVTGQGFSLEILRAGGRTTVQRIINIPSIDGASVPVVWVRSTTLTGEGDTHPVWSAWTALSQLGSPVEDFGGMGTTVQTLPELIQALQTIFTDINITNFGGTGVNITSLPELAQTLHEIFTGAKTISGKFNSQKGFYVAGEE